MPDAIIASAAPRAHTALSIGRTELAEISLKSFIKKHSIHRPRESPR